MWISASGTGVEIRHYVELLETSTGWACNFEALNF